MIWCDSLGDVIQVYVSEQWVALGRWLARGVAQLLLRLT